MADLKIQTTPWATAISHKDQFTASNQFQWHEGTQVIFNKSYNVSKDVNGTFKTNGISWYNQGVGNDHDGTCKTLFEATGYTSKMDNGRNYDQNVFFGSFVDQKDFKNDSYTYPSNVSSSFLRNVVGFAALTDIANSFSDGGAGAQAWVRKICFFYMNTYRTRKTFELKEKLYGDKNLNQQFTSSDGRNKKWFCYRLSSTDITTVTNEKLMLTGIGVHFFHSYKTVSHRSQQRLSQFRVLTASGPNFNTYPSTTILTCIPNVHEWGSHYEPQSYNVQ